MMNMPNSLYSRHLRRAWKLVESAIEGMTVEQMSWSPEGKWSSVNLIEHLSLSFMVTVKAGKMVLRQGETGLLPPTWRQRWLAFRVITLGYFPMRVIAPRMVSPRGQSLEDAKQGLLANLIEMDEIMVNCEHKFGSSIGVLAHPYLGPLSISQWRRFHLFHVRRHMKQLHRLRRQMTAMARESEAVPARPSPA
jgi:hypothetical protein